MYSVVFSDFVECWSDPIMRWFREKIARGAFDDCDLQDVIMCFDHRLPPTGYCGVPLRQIGRG